jgi:hypothetical protein
VSIESVVQAGRRLVGTSLLDSAIIMRRTITNDAGGGQGESWSAVGAAVACRFGSVVDPDPTMVIDAVYGAPTAMALLPLGTDVRRGDHLVNTDTDRTWLVVGIKTPDSNLAVAERVLIREI